MSLVEKTISKGVKVTEASDRTKTLLVKPDTTATTSTQTILTAAQTVNRTLFLPDASGTLVEIAATQTLTNKTIDAAANTISNIVNANISSSAAIAYSKLALTGSIVDSDINASAAIAYSKLALTASIVDADIAVLASISRNKLASGTANHIIVNNGSGSLSSIAILDAARGGTGVANTATLTLGANNITLNTTGVTSVTLPTSGTLLTSAGVSLTDANFQLVDDLDNTKVMQFQLSSISTGVLRTLTMPDADITLVGEALAQVLTNKDIDGGVASNQRRLTLPKNTKANLLTLTRKQGTLVYASDESTLYVDDGTSLNPVGGNWTTYNVEAISASGTISLNTVVGLQYRRVVGNATAITASNTPFGSSAPVDGCVVRLVGTDNDLTVTILNQDIAKGCLLNGTAVLGKADSIDLQYDAVLDRYIEISRNI